MTPVVSDVTPVPPPTSTAPLTSSLPTSTTTLTSTVVLTSTTTHTSTVPPTSTTGRTSTVPPTSTTVRTSTVPPTSTTVHTSTVPPTSTTVHTSTVPPTSTTVHTSTVPPTRTVTITGTVTVYSGTTFQNAVIVSGGELYVASGGVADNTTVESGGELYVASGGTADGVDVQSGGDFALEQGFIESDATFHGGTLELAAVPGGSAGMLSGFGGSGVEGFDVLKVDTGANWTISGNNLTDTTVPTLANDGSVALEGVFAFAAISGSGTATIVGNSTLEVENAVSKGETIAFDGPGGDLDLSDPSGFAGIIDHFTTLDTLDLEGFDAATPVFQNGTLTVPGTGGVAGETLTFAMTGIPADTHFSVDNTPSGAIITDNAVCFVRGTRIRTEYGEVAVEDLAIGDRVLMYAGNVEPIRWIGRRSYAGRFLAGKRHVLPVCVRAGALADGMPRRDLFVSPNHALYLDGVLVPSIELVNGVSVLQDASTESVDYVHIELAEHGVVLAEGAPAETFVDDDSRGIFHNADDYHARYPEAARVPALYCAPRLVDGYALEAIRRRIAERAGLTPPPADLGALRGSLDQVGRGEVLGWAQNAAHPDAPVCLDFLVDGVLAGQALAGLHRADLQAAGIGSGRHGFAVRLSASLSGMLEIRRSADNALLARAALERPGRAGAG
ncbi:MAG: Hint domain-containing protein [Acidisphaera sp.]|nr:Hint domain-containing protein [Acidisphaera sp.]